MLRVITRPEWGARYSDGYDDAPLPAKYLWLHQSATVAPDLLPPFDDDDAAIRELDRIGQERFGAGISYTFAVTPTGRLYQGHTLRRTGTHTYGHNYDSRAIVLVGNYSVRQPTEAQLATVARLVRYGRDSGWWTSWLSGGHRDVVTTDCPGDAAYALIPRINREATVVDEWGDFSHHRPVTLPDGSRYMTFLTPPSMDLEAARGIVAALAASYFDRGYDTIGWKISEGTGYEDPTWASAYAEARRRGKRFVGYHFDRAAFDGAAQFDWFISRWLASAGTLRPDLDVLCHDVEDTASPAGARTSMLRFSGRAVSRGYPNGLIYSGKWYAQPNNVRLDDIPAAGWRRGWLSDYTAGQADGAVELPPGWPRAWVVARQYTSTQPWPGMTGGVDFNRTLIPWAGPSTDPEDLSIVDAATKTYLDQQFASIADDLNAAYVAGRLDNFWVRDEAFARRMLGVPTGTSTRNMWRQLVAEGAKDGTAGLADDERVLLAKMDGLGEEFRATLTAVRDAQGGSAETAAVVHEAILGLIATVAQLTPGGALDLDELAAKVGDVVTTALSGSILTITRP